MGKSFAVLAMIFYQYVACNHLTYVAAFQFSNFMAILNRVASVLRLEEFDNTKTVNLTSEKSQEMPSEGYIKVENASYNWGFRLSSTPNKNLR